MRILIVEDEVNVATSLKAGLSAEGFDVDIANDGATGLWMAREHDYALIVLDVMLPERNGYLVCKDLREEGDRTPILMLTAKDGEFDQAEGLDIGADDYLTKPVSFVVLNAHIRALLRRADIARTSNVLTIGDLEIDRDSRRCRRANIETELTHREFTLLETLAANPEVVCSKDYLLDQVWGPDFDGGTNVVEVYIGYLRRKLDRKDRPSPIETARGHGYRLAP